MHEYNAQKEETYYVLCTRGAGEIKYFLVRWLSEKQAKLHGIPL